VLLPLYRDALGGRYEHASDHLALRYRAVHFGFGDGTKVELLEPLPGSTFFDRFFERNPTGGLHHLTFKVTDLTAAIEAAERAGLEVFGVSYERPEWKEAFIHPRVAHGTLVQIAEVARGFPPRIPGETLESYVASAGA
jgi:methylmalonyl-CoA/ethylmalonyl-CoA epimerase